MSRRDDPPRIGSITVRDETVTVILNPPISTLADLQSGNGDRTLRGLEAVIVEHPFTDEHDQPKAIGMLSTALITEITQAWGSKIRELPLASGRPSSPPISPAGP